MRNLVIKLCVFVAMIASVTPNVCRSNWYEPEEPEGLREFFNNHSNLAQF